MLNAFLAFVLKGGYNPGIIHSIIFMKKAILPLFLVALFGAGCFSGQEPAVPKAAEQTRPAAERAAKSVDTGKKTAGSTLAELMASPGLQKCTWKNPEQDKDSGGVVYVDGKKFRQEVKIMGLIEEGKEYVFNSVSDGEWFYTWSSVMKDKGTKFKLSELELAGKESGSAPQTSDVQATLTQKMDYSCEPWSGAADFNPPSDVKFDDQTAMLKAAQDSAVGEAE